ncbi:MAG: type II secretion system protein [Verrucomicrobiota bacterium]
MKTRKHSLKTTKTQKACGGFTFAELLLVFSIVGILFAVGASAFTNVTSSSSEVRDKRNAQTIATTASAAIAAGASELSSCHCPLEVATRLESGVTVGSGFNQIVFKTQMLKEEEKEGAVKYLRMNNGFLFYTPTERSMVGNSRSISYNP